MMSQKLTILRFKIKHRAGQCRNLAKNAISVRLARVLQHVKHMPGSGAGRERKEGLFE